MNVFLVTHQKKEDGIVRALRIAGHKFVSNADDADCLFVDHDHPGFGPRRGLLALFAERGKPTFMYPHGGNVNVAWDGFIEPYPVTANFVIGEGQREVMRRYEYPYPTVAIGWSMCLQRPFVPTDVRRVLFAPIHPPSNPDFPAFPDQTLANQQAFDACLSLDAELTVRHIGSLEANGLRVVDGVRYVEGQYDNSVADIDAVDVVVSAETFASLAVARGKAVVQFGQDTISRSETPERTLGAHWDDYKDYVRYPFDVEDGPMADVVAAAAAGSQEADEWRRLFIGDQMRPQDFSERLLCLI